MSRLTAPLAPRRTPERPLDGGNPTGRRQPCHAASPGTLATRAAAGDAEGFITGESGVGKDVVAQYIHAHSSRASRPFIAVNCAAIADTLLETELFGHARGSFTGAYRDRMGRGSRAPRHHLPGRNCRDEPADAGPPTAIPGDRRDSTGRQPRWTVRVDVRIISATNRDLEQLVATGAFRSALLYGIESRTSMYDRCATAKKT